jgi:hypothetical protein
LDGYNLMKLLKSIALMIALAACSLSTLAAQPVGLAVEAGEGDHVDIARVSLSKDWGVNWTTSWFPALGFGGFWDVSAGRWNPHAHSGGNHEVNDISITPVWRIYPRNSSGSVMPFAEAAVGVHYLSHHDIYTDRQMSTYFQFGDHVGAGLAFGDQHQWETVLRFQHLSNAGIQNPNPGINFLQLRLAYWFK